MGLYTETHYGLKTELEEVYFTGFARENWQ